MLSGGVPDRFQELATSPDCASSMTVGERWARPSRTMRRSARSAPPAASPPPLRNRKGSYLQASARRAGYPAASRGQAQRLAAHFLGLLAHCVPLQPEIRLPDGLHPADLARLAVDLDLSVAQDVCVVGYGEGLRF